MLSFQGCLYSLVGGKRYSTEGLVRKVGFSVCVSVSVCDTESNSLSERIGGTKKM